MPYVILCAESQSAMANTKKAVVRYVGDDLFVGTTPSGHAVTLDTDHTRSAAPSPAEILLVALGSCTAIDVLTILKKKRIDVSEYRIEVSGERRDENPRSYKSMNVHHIVTGKNVSPRAVEQAIELSESKYCSVAATFRPTVEIHSSYEIIEASGE
jgi:putative redox protein